MNHHYHQDTEYSHRPKSSLGLICSHSLPPEQPVLFCSLWLYIRFNLSRISNTICTLCLTFFAQYNTFVNHPCWDLSMLLCMSAICSFLLWSIILLCEYTTICSFSYCWWTSRLLMNILSFDLLWIKLLCMYTSMCYKLVCGYVFTSFGLTTWGWICWVLW